MKKRKIIYFMFLMFLLGFLFSTPSSQKNNFHSSSKAENILICGDETPIPIMTIKSYKPKNTKPRFGQNDSHNKFS